MRFWALRLVKLSLLLDLLKFLVSRSVTTVLSTEPGERKSQNYTRSNGKTPKTLRLYRFTPRRHA